MKTNFGSYSLNKELPVGCQLCVQGKKLVLFISGKCSRSCWYCSLSKKRKNKDIGWANERKISLKSEEKAVRELIQEAEESQATSAGITGGDPLLCLNRTLVFAKALKKKYGKKFHIHIYLPLNLVDKNKLLKLHSCVDEIRFHPSFLINKNEELMKKEIEKIKMASGIFGKQNTGCELPMIPDKKEEIFEFIRKISPFISFVNLNEFEISETNQKILMKSYGLNEDTYTIRKSREAGIWILEKAKKERLKLKLHFCTACTKNCYQYQNRLKLHKILPFGIKTGEGTVIYFVLDYNKGIIRKLRDFKIQFYHDIEGNRLVLDPKQLEILLKNKIRFFRSEEHPTHDKTVMERWEIKSKKEL